MKRSAIATSATAFAAILFGLLAALSARSALADDSGAAATAQFVFGAVTVVKPDGNREPVERGAQLLEGDTLVTGDDGRIHLRFADGGFVSLIPNSEFRIDAWRFTGELDGSERLAMRLLKGGLRTVSGRIGKAAQAAYEMTTRAATIGIRGTEYTLLHRPDDTVSGSVAEGRIEVCNAGGCLDVNTGLSFLAVSTDIRPSLIEKAADLGAPQPRIRPIATTQRPSERTQVSGKSDSGHDASPSKEDERQISESERADRRQRHDNGAEKRERHGSESEQSARQRPHDDGSKWRERDSSEWRETARLRDEAEPSFGRGQPGELADSQDGKDLERVKFIEQLTNSLAPGTIAENGTPSGKIPPGLSVNGADESIRNRVSEILNQNVPGTDLSKLKGQGKVKD
jgi:hypothetical protein